MLGVSDYAAFVLAIVVFLAIPGPGNLALLTSTAKGGVRGGLASTLGIMAGDQVLMWLAVAGVAAQDCRRGARRRGTLRHAARLHSRRMTKKLNLREDDNA